MLRANPGDDQQAGDQRADDGADGVGGVHAADETRRDPAVSPRPPRAPAESSRPTRIAAGSTAHRQRTRSSCNVNHGSGRNRRVDRPVRQRLASATYAAHAIAAAQQQLAHAERHARPRQVARQRRAEAAADPEADEKHRENQRERIVVAPNSSDSKRVHTTSAASAVMPDSAIAT